MYALCVEYELIPSHFPVSLLATCAIWAYNRKHQGNLNMSPAQRATYHTSMYVNIESS